MKYHLDTIPVWEAYEYKGECPLCILQNQVENSSVEFYLGSSVMEPATRIEVNKVGFCPHHLTSLYKVQNRLGLALITHTYLKNISEMFTKKAGKVISKGLSPKKSLEKLTTFLNEQQNNCLICNRINNSIARYAYTILYLWDKNKEFRETLYDSKGFCLPHLATIIKVSQDIQSPKKQSMFLSDLIPIQIKSLNKLDEELLWFTQKFDYQNQDKPWGNSKDSLPRTLQKLAGKKFD